MLKGARETLVIPRAWLLEELEEVAKELTDSYGREPPLWLFLQTLKGEESKQ